MTASRPALAVAVAVLAACSHLPPPPRHAHAGPAQAAAQAHAPQELPTMTSASAAEQALAPRLDAEQALLRLLDLIQSSGSIAEITPERLRAHFGLPFAEHGGRLGYAEQLTREWWSSYELDAARALGPRFEFAFRPAQPDAFPPAGDICAVDSARFAAALEAQGFRRETYRAEHGRVLHERFVRGGLTVTMYTRGESDASPETIGHGCVQMVHVH